MTADVLGPAETASSDAFRQDLDALGAAVAGRVRAVAAAVRRIDGLAPGGPDADASIPNTDDVRDLVLRTLRISGSPDHHRILRAVVAGTGAATALAAATDRPRIALWEAVGDLVQVGLLERDPARDGVVLTPAGSAVLALVDHLVEVGVGRP